MELTHTVIRAQKFQDLQLAHWRARRELMVWLRPGSARKAHSVISSSILSPNALAPCPNLKAESTCYMLFYSDLQ